ncbi:MAG: AAA family ATPase [Phocaeicola sp.]|nr:AAA family ATPase [Phocaeicola sp.]
MKLQQLNIHNIASIEDAVIHFDKEPLSNSEVFLITGITGSGKSTILDAICLCLYADTPRLDNTSMEGETKDGDRTIGIKDPRQLLRQNSSECFCKLTFIGNNNVHYEATWSVQRAHRKVSGRLQSKKWSLEDLDRHLIYNNDNEIRSEIRKAIGLEFKQFCRTTMLAQGEFTKFLNSKDDDKAGILQKITGVDIYSKIGAQIYRTTEEKRTAYEASKQRIDDVHILDKEEVDRIQKELDDIQTVLSQLSEEKRVDEQKVQWMKAEQELKEKLATAQQVYDSALKLIQNDDYKQKEATINDWNVTADARNLRSVYKRQKQEEDCARQTLASYKQDFIRIKQGEEWLEHEVEDIDKELKDLTEELEAQKDKAPIYAQTQMIVGQLELISKSKVFIQKETNKKARAEAFLKKELMETLAECENRLKDITNSKNDKQEKLNAKGKELAEMGLPELRQKKDDIVSSRNNIDKAFNAIETLNKERTRRKEEKEKLEKLRKEIDHYEERIAELKVPVDEAETQKEQSKQRMDKLRESIDDWTKTLRTHLHIGEKCPVCQQIINEEIPHEDVLDDLFRNAEQDYLEKERTYNELVAQQTQLKAECKAHESQYKLSKDSYDKDKTVQQSEEEAQKACEVCNILFDENTIEQLDKQAKDLSNRLNELNEQIKNGEQFEKEVNTIRVEFQEVQDSLLKTVKEFNDINSHISDCKKQISAHEGLIAQKQKEISESEAHIQPILENVEWMIDWKEDPGLFATNLKQENENYINLQDALTTKKKILDDYQKSKDEVSGSLKKMVEQCPDWDCIQTNDRIEFPEVLNATRNLEEKITKATTRIQLAVQQKEEALGRLDEFVISNPQYSMERLEELSKIQMAEINRLEKELTFLRNDVFQKKGSLKQVDEQLNHHLTHKPEMDEKDNAASLNEQILLLEDKIKQTSEKRGSLQNQMDEDQRNRTKQADLIKKAEEQKVIYNQWARLNSLLGNADGKKFMKIAQSYVLSNMVHAANRYLRTLTNRYTLRVLPGSFTIMMEDAYQGYAERPASTISGGESFLVSLSLALALSDIGQQLSVDILFIDEGFGTLSGEPLMNAINTLRSLHTASGRQVGIISHVEELQERIPVQIQVVQDGNSSKSEVNVVTIN